MSDKLDRLVSEKVMGWPHITFLAEATAGGYIRLGTPYRGADHPTDRCGKWCPSTDMAAAWDVVRKLRDVKHTEPEWNERWDWAFAIHSPQDCQHWATFYRCGPGDIVKDDSRVIATACGGTEGEAICRAALLAVGVPESEIQDAMR